MAQPVTNGDAGVASGGSPAARRRAAQLLAAAVLVAIAAINALTVAHDSAQAGRPLRDWEPWLWEFSSTFYWVVMLPVFGWLAVHVRPPRLTWPATIAAHAALTLPVSAGHVLTLFVVRNLVYAGLGLHYDYGLDAAHLAYEYRKDMLAYGVLVVAAAIIDHWALLPAGATVAAAEPGFRLEVRDGARTLWLTPDEIDWIEAAGNYVELQTRHGAVLHRATLAGVAQLLQPHGFVRIHRSRLVRRTAVRGIRTTAAGDFELQLDSGARVAGSRRFRANLSDVTARKFD